MVNKIFEYVDQKTVFGCSKVSSQFFEVVKESQKNIYTDFFKTRGIKVGAEDHLSLYIKYLNDYWCDSIAETRNSPQMLQPYYSIPSRKILSLKEQKDEYYEEIVLMQNVKL